MIVFNAFFKPNLLLNVHARSMNAYHHSSHIAGNWAPKVITDTLWQKCHSCIRFFYGAYQPKHSWPPGIMSRRRRIVKEVPQRSKFSLPENELLYLFFATLPRAVAPRRLTFWKSSTQAEAAACLVVSPENGQTSRWRPRETGAGSCQCDKRRPQSTRDFYFPALP